MRRIAFIYLRFAFVALALPLALTGQTSVQYGYSYDANGRLMQVFTGNGAINYTLDNASNRAAVQTSILSCAPIVANQKEGTGHTYPVSCTDSYGSSARISGTSNACTGTLSLSYHGLNLTITTPIYSNVTCAFTFTVTDSSSPAGQDASVTVPATITSTLN